MGTCPRACGTWASTTSRTWGVSTCRGGSRLVATPLVTLMTVPFFFFFSDCLLVFLCLFQIVPHVGERHRDMILKVCSYLKTIIWDKYKNDDAATSSIFFFAIGGNFEVSFKAATDIALKVRPWSCTFAHLQRTCSLNLCVLHLYALMVICALNVCALHLFDSCSRGLITSAWTPRCSWRRARS